jgi:hypothetical protein
MPWIRSALSTTLPFISVVAGCARHDLLLGPLPPVASSEVAPVNTAMTRVSRIPIGVRDSVPLRGPVFIREGWASVHTLRAEPLYVVDGAVLGRRHDGTIDRQAGQRALQVLDPRRIVSIEVLKDIQAVQRFGPSGSNGAVLILTRQLTSARSARRRP